MLSFKKRDIFKILLSVKKMVIFLKRVSIIKDLRFTTVK